MWSSSSSFIWLEVSNHLSCLDEYVLSLTCRAGREHYVRHRQPGAVFDTSDLANRGAWAVLTTLSGVYQLLLPADCLQTEVLQNRDTQTTKADWAARKGYLQLLRWLSSHGEACTTYAMDFAARNGHLDVLQWLQLNRREGCTDAAANWAAYKGRLDVVEWLYCHTASRCCELATMLAAGHGDLRMLRWLLAHGVISTTSAANYAFAGGHTEAEELLAAYRGCRRCMTDDDADMIARIRKTLQIDASPIPQWD